jgi:hypothetical protein
MSGPDRGEHYRGQKRRRKGRQQAENDERSAEKLGIKTRGLPAPGTGDALLFR